MQPAEIRLECLKLIPLAGKSPADRIADAQVLFAWVTAEQNETAETRTADVPAAQPQPETPKSRRLGRQQ